MSAQPAEPLAQLLDRVESLLARQIACARSEDYAAVLALGPKVESALRQAGSAGEKHAPDLLERRRRIQALRKNLGLLLAQSRHELGEKLSRLRKGKGTLQAYRDNSTRL